MASNKWIHEHLCTKSGSNRWHISQRCYLHEHKKTITEKMDLQRLQSLKSSRKYRATMTDCSTRFLSAFSHFDIISQKAQKHSSYHTAIYKANLQNCHDSKTLLVMHRKEARIVYCSIKHRTKEQHLHVHKRLITIFLMLLGFT